MEEALTTKPRCPYCSGEKVDRAGTYYRSPDAAREHPIQRWQCQNKKCNRRFSDRTFHHISSKDDPAHNILEQVCGSGPKNLSQTSVAKNNFGEITDPSFIQYAFKSKKNGNKEKTIAYRIQRLKALQHKGANLSDSDSVESILALEEWKPSIKWHLVQAYQSYTKLMGIPWTKIRCRYEPKQQYTPSTVEFEALVAGLGTETATFVQALGKTGARCGEMNKLEFSEVDVANKRIYINKPEKNGKSRVIPVDEKTIAMIMNLPKKYEPYCFNPCLHTLQTTFSRSRDLLADKLQASNLKLITFHGFRRYYADQEYKKSQFNTRRVQARLGHKHMYSTEKYFKDWDGENCAYHTERAYTIEDCERLRQEGYTRYDEGVDKNGKPCKLYSRLT